MVLIITQSADGHLPFVLPHLTGDVLVIDPMHIALGRELSFAFVANHAKASYGMRRIAKVQSVWYRKPEMPQRTTLPVPEGYREYAFSALTRHITELKAQFPNALWVSDFYAISRAANKMHQLQTAADIRLRVPDTLATSNKQRAAAFMRCYQSVIVKSPADCYPCVDGEYRFFPATIVHRGQHISLDGLRVAPAIFQQAIDAVADVRVTVIGLHVFAAIIRDKGMPDKPNVRDWRVNHTVDRQQFEPFVLPRPLRAACLSLVRRLGLQYGAIDLVIDKRGNYWFLEINPNGQWAFIETDTGLPLGAAMALLLESGSSSPYTLL